MDEVERYDAGSSPVTQRTPKMLPQPAKAASFLSSRCVRTVGCRQRFPKLAVRFLSRQFSLTYLLREGEG